MEKRSLFVFLAACAFITVACSCNLLNGLFTEEKGPVVSTQGDGSLVVNPTNAAEAEIAVQTQQAMINATQQAMIEKVEATAQALNPTEENPDPVETYLPTPQPGVPTVSVSVDTNCRVGPGVGYETVYHVLVGQSVEVVGIDSTGSYYIIQQPYGGTCWLWAHYATLNGDPNTLTVMVPPEPPLTDDYRVYIEIQDSEDFTWSGHWVVGSFGGQTYTDMYNAQIAGCQECFRYESVEMDIVQEGNFLNIEMTEAAYWLDGNASIHIVYGLAEVSKDNTIAAGVWYLEEVIAHTISQNIGSAWPLDFTFVWAQNGNPNQFVEMNPGWGGGICGAKNGEAIPVPCVWP
jgi:hypothetical protein